MIQVELSTAASAPSRPPDSTLKALGPWASRLLIRSLSSKLQRRPRKEYRAAAIQSSEVNECDVVVIGSGIGGLTAGSLLATYGLDVVVCESHGVIGGAAHSWKRKGYHFESGPSLYSGMASKGPEANPLSGVLQAISEPLEIIEYDVWNVYLPEVPNGYPAGVGPEGFTNLFKECAGPEALDQWRTLQKVSRPLTDAATAIPPLAIRLDPGVFLSGFVRYFGRIISSIWSFGMLTKPFSEVLNKANVTDPFVRNYMDLLCFLLSGMPADGTIAAEVVFMLKEWCDPDSKLEFPVGGSQAMADALARGVTKNGGSIRVNSHVESIRVEDGRAVGIVVRKGNVIEEIRCRKGVVSNASSFDTMNLLPSSEQQLKWQKDVEKTPLNPSFMHLHIGFDASGLEHLDLHHLVVDTWDAVDAEQNVVLISIASVADASLAPKGKHCLHAYYPATEPWEIWENLRGDEYKRLKEERSKALWRAVERVIPDIQDRVEYSCVGSPLTHARYLRRHKGTYGPAWKAGEEVFPFGNTPIKDLYCVGDFTFPGIGLPAVAASGAVVANSIVPLAKHEQLLESIGL